MELTLHPIATKCFVSGRDFAENDRVASYLVREATGEVTRRDLLESEDQPSPGFGTASGRFMPPAFVYCRWVVGFKQRKAEEDPARMLKLTADNLFLTLATPAGSETPDPGSQTLNTPLLQFLALMLERKKLIKLRGYTEDGQRQIYEHMPTHQLYEVPVGDLNAEFFRKIQEHLGVLVDTRKPKPAEKEPGAGELAPAGQDTTPV
jgi:hypothetical protein